MSFSLFFGLKSYSCTICTTKGFMISSFERIHHCNLFLYVCILLFLSYFYQVLFKLSQECSSIFYETNFFKIKMMDTLSFLPNDVMDIGWFWRLMGSIIILITFSYFYVDVFVIIYRDFMFSCNNFQWFLYITDARN